MTRAKALQLLKEFADRPIFNVKIGVCSPEITDATFEEALEVFDQCGYYDTDRTEFVYMYISDFVNKREEFHQALNLFNLGPRRDRINNYANE